MRLKNTDDWYGLVAQALHWVMAALIAWLFWVGLTMVDLPLSPAKFETYNFHKSLGITALALAVIRLLWRFANRQPALPPGMKPWEKRLAGLSHIAIYVLLLAIPLSGWLQTSAAAIPINWFGLATLPSILPPGETAAKALALVHDIAGKLLLALIALHVVAALKHHLVDRDTVLRRMIRPAP